MKKNIILFSILSLFMFTLNCCNKNKKVLEEDFINLYPDKDVIKKAYYKYSLFDPFFPKDSLYTSIEPSKIRPNMSKTLINQFEFYDLRNFSAYIKKNMGGV